MSKPRKIKTYVLSSNKRDKIRQELMGKRFNDYLATLDLSHFKNIEAEIQKKVNKQYYNMP